MHQRYIPERYIKPSIEFENARIKDVVIMKKDSSYFFFLINPTEIKTMPTRIHPIAYPDISS